MPDMRVRYAVTVEVDAAAWNATYGTATEQVRGDVRTYIDGLIRDSAAADECDLRPVTGYDTTPVR